MGTGCADDGFNAEAPENLEDGLFPFTKLARKVTGGDQFFGPGLWLRRLTKPSQDTGKHEAELIRPEHSQSSDRPHLRIR